MSDDGTSRADREGIYIDEELAESVAIEEELDSNVIGPYRFPSPSRRRIAGWVFIGGAVITTLTVSGGWVPAIGLVALAAWNFAAAWPLTLGEHKALEVAASVVDFPVGHASAAVTFKGLRSRPRWSVVLYSADEPPSHRALVVVDAVDGTPAEEPYVERVPD